MVLRWSRASALRCCHLGAQQPFGKRAPDRELLGILLCFQEGCWSILTGSVNIFIGTAAALAGPLSVGFFWKEPYREINPLPNKAFGLFLFLNDFFKIII